MAQGRRVERVAALIRREMSELLTSGIKDERVQHGMVSVTSVEVAGDLQHCKIFVSIFGSDEDREVAMAGLKAAAVYVKGELGRRLKMRRTPEVVFVLDRGLERGNTVLGLLQRLETDRRQRGGEDAEEAVGDGAGEDPASGTGLGSDGED
ncbi:30S ribosome-binding factor RbfA [Synechococcus sp. CCY 9618]|uniref:30S ribosome-binding factor RbfA n=1 Tax=Synechococcus sp. CCY 9618 TaxID=2815602 RepID=UPI001C2113B2|nr:30S ribosome-binding factor RbfA [Synechococcus sp. CCY 9618]